MDVGVDYLTRHVIIIVDLSLSSHAKGAVVGQ